jgi:tripartite-type tricarboxylate transporter receptor subunit TctC
MFQGITTRFLAVSAAAAAFAASAPLAARADGVADFYKKKEIAVVVGTSAGGSYDTSARAVARHFGRHVPGNPTVVVQNRPGASSRVAANWLYNAGPRDGSVIGAFSQTLGMSQALGQRGIKYDAGAFNWIGTPIQPVSIMVAWKAAGFKSLMDAKDREMVVGATSATGANFIYPALANYLFGLKLKIIIGYKGGNEIDLALERGEIAARGSATWNDIKSDHADWLREKKVVILIQNSLKKHRDLPRVPRFVDLAETPDQRAVLELMGRVAEIGRPWLTNRGVPDDRVKALRAGFDATMKDAKFLSEAKKLKMEIDPLTGAELQAMVASMVKTPKHIVDLTNAALSKDGTQCEKFTEAKYCAKKKKKKKKKAE